MQKKQEERCAWVLHAKGKGEKRLEKNFKKRGVGNIEGGLHKIGGLGCPASYAVSSSLSPLSVLGDYSC